MATTLKPLNTSVLTTISNGFEVEQGDKSVLNKVDMSVPLELF